jgi:hypothetical protein
MSLSIPHLRARALVAAAALAFTGAASAADPPPQQQPRSGQSQQHGMMGSNNMMGGDMMGMMDMMKSCQSMMGDTGMGGAAMGMSRFPPGNEKLEAQMHAEMMQKMGEIAARYADKIKEAR